MKLVNIKGQQFCGNRFTATPLRKTLKNTGARSIPGNTVRSRYGYGSPSRVTWHFSMAKKRELKSANDARIGQSQELLAETKAILPEQKSAFDEIAMCAKDALLSKGGFAGMASLDHPLVIAYLSSCQEDNRLIYVSPQIAKLGLSQEAWLGKTDLRLQQVHEDDYDRFAAAIQHSRSTGEKFNCHYRLYDSNKKIRWYHDEASVVCNESGTPLFIRGVMLDITDKKEMEAELNQHRYYLERHVELRTGQLIKRMALLESCNATLGSKLALARTELAALKRQSAAATIQSSQVKVPISPTQSNNCAEQLHDIGDHARTMIDLTRNNWIAHGGYKPKAKKCATPDMQLTQATQITSTDDYAEQLDGISDWARNMIGWRMAAAGAIA
jgi:PAS domain S-box-containing protein